MLRFGQVAALVTLLTTMVTMVTAQTWSSNGHWAVPDTTGMPTTVDIPTTMANMYQGCDSNIQHLTVLPGQIRSPNYPDNYPANTVCRYRITVPEGRIAAFRVDDLSVEGHQTPWLCKYDYLDVYNGPEETDPPFARVCGDPSHYMLESHIQVNGTVVRGNRNELFLKFVTDGSNQFRGFQLTYFDEAPACGGHLEGTSGWITSSKRLDYWPYHEPYRNNIECIWTITVEEGLYIWLEFDEFDFEKCPGFDFLEISDGPEREEDGANTRKLCDRELPEPFESTGNSLYLFMKTDHSMEHMGFRANFRAFTKEISCGTELTAETGTLSYPQGGSYLPGTHCIWTITVPQDKHIVISIADFDVGESPNCQHDFLEIRNGGSLDSPILKRLCGDASDLSSIVTDSYQVYIRFKSGASSVGHSGFTLNYHTQPGCGSNLTSFYGVIQSPNYPNGFPAGLNCTWRLNLPHGQTIRLLFQDLDLRSSDAPDYYYYDYHYDSYHHCQETYALVNLSAAHHDDWYGSSTNKRLCGNGTVMPINSEQSSGYIQFVSSANGTAGRGFQVMYELGCSKEFYDPTGNLSSPNFPHAYARDADCQWSVYSWSSHHPMVTINVSSVAFTDCATQKLQILDYFEQVLASVCGPTALPTEITLYTYHFYVKYESGPVEDNEGFHLSWNVQECYHTLTARSGNFSSPNYPDFMPIVDWCGWEINPGNGNKVTLTFSDVAGMDCYDSPVWVQYYREGMFQDVPLCNNNETVFISDQTIHVIAYNYEPWRKAKFTASYVSECGGTLDADEGGHLGWYTHRQYDTPQQCTWTLRTNSTSNHVFLNLEKLNISRSPECQTGSLAIQTGANNNPYVLCGDERPVYAEIPFSGPEVTVTFDVQEGSVGSGFYANFYTSEPSCDAILFDETGEISSPNYPDPSGKSCTWRIIAPLGQRVQLTITAMDLGGGPSDCSYAQDSLTIYDLEPFGTSTRLCMSGISEPLVHLSTGHEMTVNLYSNYYSSHSGFTATYTFVDGCGGELHEPQGAFSLPEDVSALAYCEWLIEVEEGKALLLHIDDYNNKETDCRSGLSVKTRMPYGQSLGPSCGTDVFPKMFSWRGNELSVTFTNPQESSRLAARYEQVDMAQLCSGTFQSESSVFTSPENMNHCAGQGTGEYLMQVPEGMNIDFSIYDSYMVYDYNNYDYNQECPGKIQVYDGATTASPMLFESCHGHSMGHSMGHSSVYSSSNQMLLKTSSGHVVFMATFSEVCYHNVTAENGVIESPQSSEHLADGFVCTWEISIPEHIPAGSIVLTFVTLDLASHGTSECDPDTATDMIELYHDRGSMYHNNAAHRLCAGSSMTDPFVSNGQTVFIKMTSQPSSPGNIGFKATFQAVCHTTEFSTSYPQYINFHPRPSDSDPYECSWTFSSEIPDRVIELEFFSYKVSDEGNCEVDYIEVQNGDSVSRYCDSPIPNTLSQGQAITVVFHKGSNSTGGFFSLQHHSKTLYMLTEASGTFHSINHPGDYVDNHKSDWLIRGPENSHVKLYFEAFNVEFERDCDYDSVSIYDGSSATSGVLRHKLCGGRSTVSMDCPYKSVGREMFVTFSTDSSVTHSGFLAHYTIVAPCQETLTSPAGTLSFSAGMECNWLINVDPGLVIQLDTTAYPNRNYSCRCQDVSGLQVYDGRDTSSLRLTSRCHESTFPEFIVSSSNQLFVHFGGLDVPQDFSLSYTTFSRTEMCQRTFSELSGVFSTPPVGTQCGNVNPYWKITLPEGLKVNLRVMNSAGSVSTAGVQLHDGPDSSSPSVNQQSVSSVFSVNGSWTSSSNNLYISFTNPTLQGSFTLSYKSSCQHNLTGASGTFTSLGYPNNYLNAHECYWDINGLRDLHLTVTFDTLTLDGSSCSDRIVVKTRDGTDQVLCQSSDQGRDISTHSNHMGITFITDTSGTAQGFSASYLSAGCGSPAPITVYQYSTNALHSPNYPKAYYNNLDCTWTLHASSPGHVIYLDLNNLDLPGTDPAGDCSGDYIQVTQEDGGVEKHCGSSSPTQLVSTGQTMTVLFHSDDQTDGHTGFRAQYHSELKPCGGNLTATGGVLTSPNHPENYYNDLNCVWRLLAPPGHTVHLTFTAFNLEYHASCDWDSVKIYDGNSVSSSNLMKTLCNQVLLPHQTSHSSTGRNMTVHFHTDESVVRPGFRAEYTFNQE